MNVAEVIAYLEKLDPETPVLVRTPRGAKAAGIVFGELKDGGVIFQAATPFETPHEPTPLEALFDAALEAKNLTRRAASLKAQLNEHFLRDWLSGKVRSPSGHSIDRIAAVAGVTVEQCFDAMRQTQ